MDKEEFQCLVRKVAKFVLKDGRLWGKDPMMKHKPVVDEEKLLDLLKQVHDELGHKGIFTTANSPALNVLVASA
jgi:hypothetical protein